MTAKKCTKKCAARAKLLFCLSNLLLFEVAAAVAVVVAKVPYLVDPGGGEFVRKPLPGGGAFVNSSRSG